MDPRGYERVIKGPERKTGGREIDEKERVMEREGEGERERGREMNIQTPVSVKGGFQMD